MSAGQEAPAPADQQQPSTSHAGGFPQYSTAGHPPPNNNHFAHAAQHQPLSVSTGSAMPPHVYGGPPPGSEAQWMQQPPPAFYYHGQGGPMPPQRSPLPPAHPDGAPPSSQAPQLVVPRQDGAPGQPIGQHSPAARRPMSGQPPPGWPPMHQGPVDPNDPNAQHPQQHPHMPPQYPTQQPMMHPGYQPGMHPPPGYWAPPPHQQRYAQYPGDPNAFQPPPPHMMHPGSQPGAGGHPYYLQVPQHHHYGGKPAGPEGLPPFSAAPDGHPAQHQPPPTSAAPPPPSSSSGPMDDEEAKRRLQPPAMPPPNVHHVSPGYQPGMHPSMHPGHPNMAGQPPPQMTPPPGMPPGHAPPMQGAPPYNAGPLGESKAHLLKPQQREAVEKLVGQPSELIPQLVIPTRRIFFENVVFMNDQTGEALTAPPQVSKSTIDLHRLYLAVRKRGGFEQVTKEKSWKNLCTEANPRMTESSAAGYQLRRHYQKYLLPLECVETGKNAEELKAFADKLKKKKKEKEPPGSAAGPSTPGQPASAAGPPTPSSIRSAATPTPQHAQQPPPQPSPSSSVGAPPARMSPFPPMHGMPPGAPPPGYPPHPSGDPNAAYYYAQQQQQHAAAMAAQQQQHPGMGPPPQHMQPPHSGAPNWPPQQSPMQPPRFPMPGKQMPPSSSAGPPPVDFRRPQMPPGSMAGGTPSAQPSPYFAPPHSGSPSMPSPGSAQRARQQPPPPTSQSLPPTTSNAPFMHPGQQSQPPPQSTPSIATSSALGPPQTPQQVPPTSAAAFPAHGAPPAAATGGPFMHPGHHPGAPAAGNAPFGHMQPPPQHPGAQLPPHHPAAARMPGAPYGGPQMPHHHQQAPTSMGSAQFPPNSLEATATRSAFNRRRPKLAARDYAGITTRQLCMALRSGQEMEVVFALNALTALLYDDTQWPPLQLANEPQLLTLALEHLRATLAVLYPKEFEVNETAELLPHTQEFDGEAFDELPFMKARMEKGKEEAVARKLSLVDAAKYRPTEAEKVTGSSTRPKTHESAPIASTSALSSKITPPNHVVGNYTLRTRSGKRVYVEPRAKRPMALDRLYEELKEDTPNGTPENVDLSFAELRLQMETGTGSSIADRMFRCLRTRLNARRALAKPKGSLADVIAEKNAGVNKENEEELEVDGTTPKIEKGGPEFFYREAHPWEVWDRFAKPDCSLLPRQAPVQERDPALQELADRALCLSNIVRGFALIPGNEPLMHANRPLLHLAGRLLMLMVGEDEQQRVAREKAAAGTSAAEKPKKSVAADVKKEPESDAMEVDTTAAAQPTAKPAEGEPTVDSSRRSQNCAPERDSDEKLLLETANSLRDDAFVVLAQLSQFTDLYALESEISEPLLDALLHWAVTTNVQAQDPIAPGLISPRAYVFEIVSKYSLLERNVDLLLSTGSWPRLEEFVRVVCSFITMTEDPPIREFAIVILNAISVASESVCLVAAQQTNAIHNLISFLEVADQNMATIASTSGLDALRDNPEQIGTSIPMLRRAAQILVNFVHHELCRGPFKTHENKLLSLTVSHVMDSQVANKLTSVLYEIQQLPATKEPKQNEISDDDYERLAAMFPSCTWRISDDEQPLPPVAFLPAAPLPAFQPADVKPPAFNGLFGPSGVNGIEAMPVNGSAKPRRKRLHCHPDGRPMTALERELLRDSDAESVDGDEEAVGGLDNGGHSAPPPAHEPPHLKTTSESVKERIRNNILRHEHEHEELLQQQQAAAADEPEAKRTRIVGNGVISPKCNGDLKVRPAGGQTNAPTKAENGTPPTQSTGSGSMQAVA